LRCCSCLQDQVFVLGSEKAREFITALSYVSMMPIGQHLPGIQRCEIESFVLSCEVLPLVLFSFFCGWFFLSLPPATCSFCGVGGSQTLGVHRCDATCAACQCVCQPACSIGSECMINWLLHSVYGEHGMHAAALVLWILHWHLHWRRYIQCASVTLGAQVSAIFLPRSLLGASQPNKQIKMH
jgi:hypothetical protein